MKKLLVLLTAVAMLASFATIASASEFSFYGNARLYTFSWEDSKEVNAVPHFDRYWTGAAGGDSISDSNSSEGETAFNESDRDLDMSLSPYSRFGAKIAISDELSAHMEFGLNSSSVSMRHFNGEYDFGAGKILVGQAWNPSVTTASYSNQVGNADDGLGSIGAFTAGRRAQVRLSFGDFAIHFMTPDHPTIAGIGNGVTNATTADATATALRAVYKTDQAYYDDDISWPHIAAAYNVSYENFKFGITGAFQSYEVSDTRGDYFDSILIQTVSGGSYDIDSHNLKIGVQGNFGLLTLGATYGFGQNLANMGLSANSSKGSTPGAEFDRDSNNVGYIKDVDTTAYTIVGSFKLNDMVTLEAGYGKVINDIDEALQDDEAHAYYLQAAIQVADGFVITPEIGKYDYEEDGSGNDEGDSTYFGAKWQINF